ncbi:MAG: hypothetical protein KBS95_03035 [Alistipes sp.]|nr:hypothetical protein [Candidatus Alistipes equi]
MKRYIILAVLVFSFTVGICNVNWKAINRQAQKEYLSPVHPGKLGVRPYWNDFAKKFIYAPSFGFKAVNGAEKYLFTVREEKADGCWQFKASSPEATLSPIWNKIPVGHVVLTVEALDGKGQVISKVGERKFFRDYPFEGPYHEAVRPYKAAAIMTLASIHNMSAVQNWKKTSKEPDMSYPHNTYANKIIGSTVSSEILLAKLMPKYMEDAIKIAKNAAEFLISMSAPEGSPLAFFPPTYYGGLIASKKAENQGKTMTMDAAYSANAFLDLYDFTGEKLYYDRALGIADTFVRLQREDGSLPIKVDFYTGEPVNNSCAMLSPMLSFFSRLKNQYKVSAYDEAAAKGEKWMNEHIVSKFDMTGQFEDVSVSNLRPYENLTNCTATAYASYILSSQNPSTQAIETAYELVRMSEDQFVYWDQPKDENGMKRDMTPCVFEQYKYAMPVDNSACNVANAMLSIYENTSDKLMFLKAKAFVDNLTIVQDVITGRIPTTWRNRKKATYWINCNYASARILLRFDELNKDLK